MVRVPQTRTRHDPTERDDSLNRARGLRGAAAGLAIASLLLAAGCDSDTTAPGSSSFQLEIAVVDSAGNALPGMRVSAQNKLLGLPIPVSRSGRAMVKPPPSQFFMYPCYPNPFEGTTTLKVDLPLFCEYRFTFLRLDGDTADVFHDDSADAGTHTLVWLPPDTIPAVYLCRFTAGPIDSPILVDSTHAVSWAPGPEHHALGFTGATGRVVTTDSVRFPGLFALPEMVWTNELGTDTMGLFRFSDTLEILVTDTLLGEDRPFERHLRPGPNTFEVIWVP